MQRIWHPGFRFYPIKKAATRPHVRPIRSCRLAAQSTLHGKKVLGRIGNRSLKIAPDMNSTSLLQSILWTRLCEDQAAG